MPANKYALQPTKGRARPGRRESAHLAAAAVAALLVICAPGCRDEERNPGASRATTSADSQIDRIRALGYADYSPEKADPNLSGVAEYEQGRYSPGFNLYSNREPCSAFLIDADGTVLNSWTDPESRHWANCELLPDGDLLVVGKRPIPKRDRDLNDESRYLRRLTWHGDTVWERSITAHHDVEVTPRDQLLVLGLAYRRVPAISREYEIRDDVLTVLTQDGRPVEEHSIYDLLASDPDLFTFQTVAPQGMKGKPMIDLLHSNSAEWMHHPELASVDPLYAPSNILFCMRNQDAIAVVDWDRKKLLWSWGRGIISGPHDATVLESGHILLFDNGLGRSWSRVLELDPLSKEIVWEYRAAEPEDFYSASRDSNQRPPNGNTLIAESDTGRAFEITPEGRTVWEFFNPLLNQEGHRATISRIRRYPASYIQPMLDKFGVRESRPES